MINCLPIQTLTQRQSILFHTKHQEGAKGILGKIFKNNFFIEHLSWLLLYQETLANMKYGLLQTKKYYNHKFEFCPLGPILDKQATVTEEQRQN